VAYTPYEAKGHSSRVTINLQAQFNKMATNPPVDKLYIMIHDGTAQRIWGNIVIQNQNNISVWDVLYGIYAYFQTPITTQELAYLETLDESNHTNLIEAARRRGASSPIRVDSLWDQRRFWGLWITNRAQEGWFLNLGLTGP
jgi:hypothetical protein